MKISLIGIILVSSIKNLFNKQPDVLKHTPQTGMTEWNLGHHLANEIVKYIFWLDHDLDVTKRNHENKRPDIIFHKRGSNEFNFLVIEIKINGSVEKDIRKIKDEWMHGQLHYRFGASINVKSKEKFIVTVFDNTGCQEDFSKTTPRISSSEFATDKQKAEIESLVDKILTAKSADRDADVAVFERRIDVLVAQGLSLNGIQRFGS